jgi:hypothetical protein
MDDFLFFTVSTDVALKLRDRVASLLDRLGLGRNHKKGRWEPTQSASTSASRSTLQPLPSEPLLQNYTPLQPSPGPY